MTSRKKPQQKRSKVPFYVGGAILALLLVAFITTGLSGDDNTNGTSNTQEYADVSVSGDSLPPLPEEGGDPAVGMTMPEVTGESFDGTPVTITNDGRAKVILFLAHW